LRWGAKERIDELAGSRGKPTRARSTVSRQQKTDHGRQYAEKAEQILDRGGHRFGWHGRIHRKLPLRIATTQVCDGPRWPDTSFVFPNEI
jgi:hypothetical protein